MRICQRCGKSVTGSKRFCSSSCSRADYAQRKRTERAEFTRAVLRAVAEHIRLHGCICPECDGKCVKRRGRPRKRKSA